MSVDSRVACCGRHTEEERRIEQGRRKRIHFIDCMSYFVFTTHNNETHPVSHTLDYTFFFFFFFSTLIPTSSYHRHFLELFFLFSGTTLVWAYIADIAIWARVRSLSGGQLFFSFPSLHSVFVDEFFNHFFLLSLFSNFLSLFFPNRKNRKIKFIPTA